QGIGPALQLPDQRPQRHGRGYRAPRRERTGARQSSKWGDAALGDHPPRAAPRRPTHRGGAGGGTRPMTAQSARRFHHVAVLMGGLSAEREVSLNSGDACAKALESAGYAVTRIDAGRDLAHRLAETKPEVCFNALHGRWGEDGCVQGMLE